MSIEICNIKKNFGEKIVFDGLSLTIFDGVTAVMGQSGKGKTTLLRMLSGLDKDFEGRISGVGSVSFCPQDMLLLPWYSAEKNLKVFLSSSGIGDGEIDKGLSAFGLSDEKKKKPRELSGGMCQRVAILRAWLFDSDTVILDEPFKGLDSETKASVISYLKSTRRDGRKVIFTTHSEDEAKEFADNILTV